MFQQSALRCSVAGNRYYRDRDGDARAQDILSSSPVATLANFGPANTLGTGTGQP